MEDDNVMMISLEDLVESFTNQKQLPIETALEIIHQAYATLAEYPNVLTLQAPVTVCGDLHGQFFDLLAFAEKNDLAHPSAENQFLFLGDYVDRGAFSCEVILYLLRLKIQYPSYIHLLRGNHECEAISSFYGFRTECTFKYGLSAYYHFLKCFQMMPLIATVSTSYGKFMCVHGGLSPEIETIEDIMNIDRKREPLTNGALCDLLWSDPSPEGCTDDSSYAKWHANDVRGCSYQYGHLAVFEFLQRNDLVAIIRAHELQKNGFAYHFSSLPEEFDTRSVGDKTIPPVITVFSAPNYCDQHHNNAGHLYITADRSDFNISTCENVVHPTPLSLSRSKSIEIEQKMKQVFPYLPTTAELFDRIVAVVTKKRESTSSSTSSSNDFNVGLDLDDCIESSSSYDSDDAPSECQEVLDEESLLLNSPRHCLSRCRSDSLRRRLSSEIHPVAMQQALDAAAADWIENETSESIHSFTEIDHNDRTSVFTKEELDFIKLMFSLMDVNGDLNLRPEEISLFVTNILGVSTSEELVLSYFNALDFDQDGLVSFTDLLECVALLKEEYQESQLTNQHRSRRRRPSLPDFIKVPSTVVCKNSTWISRFLTAFKVSAIVFVLWIIKKKRVVPRLVAAVLLKRKQNQVL